MPRIQLQLYILPGAAEAFINIKRNNGIFQRFAGNVDTGAEVSLLPLTMMADMEYRLGSRAKIIVDQAGIARQSFEAIEAFVTIFLEDETGSRTNEFEIPVWFAATDQILIGFAGILDQAILHIDMQQRDGWIELDP